MNVLLISLLFVFHTLNMILLALYIDVIKKISNTDNIQILILSIINTCVHFAMFINTIVIIIHEDLNYEYKRVKCLIPYTICLIIMILGFGYNLVFSTMHLIDDTIININNDIINIRTLIAYSALSLIDITFMIYVLLTKINEDNY